MHVLDDYKIYLMCIWVANRFMALTNSSQSYSFLGKLTVEPRNGTALQTLFTATVQGCEDDDDVQYQFGIRSASESFTFSQQTENFKSTHLAPGKNCYVCQVYWLKWRLYRSGKWSSYSFVSSLVLLDICNASGTKVNHSKRFKFLRQSCSGLNLFIDKRIYFYLF